VIAGWRDAHPIAQVGGANAPAVRHPVTLGQDVMEDALHIGEGFIVHGEQLLEAVAAGQSPIRDLVLDVVGDHELVHGGQVALNPRLLEVAADESFVFLCGHGTFSSHTHFLLAGNHPFRRKHDATDQSSTRTSIEDTPRGSGLGRRSAWFLAPALLRIAIRAQPQSDVSRLHRLPHHTYQIIAQGIQVRLLAWPRRLVGSFSRRTCSYRSARQ
jgi:hypothetical protein